MARIYIDGHAFEVDPSRNLLEVVLELGQDLPYFCWHPALGSVGACRQCAVTQFRDEQDTRGKVVMACMTPCTDGSRFSLQHDDAVEMREAVVELLMTNHPHDCPVCEEGGSCHLQDMTVMTGHNYRRYRYNKRTHRNQDLGPFVSHEMNRCIACYRCVRFYREYADGTDLNVFGAHNHVYFGRASDGTLESPFSGNLVEVCPTGVFTDKPYGESYTRKWDLQQAPSVCHHCAVGCNIFPGERYGRIKRVENRYHGALNGYFLCDRGRYGYQHANAEARPRTAMLRERPGAEPQRVATDAALESMVTWLQTRTLGIGSPRASLEANQALRALIGAERCHRGVAVQDAALDDLMLQILRQGPAQIASITDIEQADAVLILGEDVSATGARVELALRQSVRQHALGLADASKVPRWQTHSVQLLGQDARSPLFVATPAATRLDGIASKTYRGAPQDIARLGQEIVHLLDYTQPRAPGLDDDTIHLAHTIAEALKSARRPLIVSGAGCASAAVLQEAGNIVTALAHAGAAPSIVLLPAECNSLGTAMLGGADLDAALTQIESGEIDTLIVVENDLYRRVPAARLDAALARLQHLVVIDALATPTTQRADLLLPAGSFAETDGTLVNYEGRAQRYFQVFQPGAYVGSGGDVRESWRWLQQAALQAQGDIGTTLDDLTRACAHGDPALAAIVDAAPNAGFRITGQRIPRQSQRYSGRTAMNAAHDIHEPRPPQDADTPLAFSMEGARVDLPSAEIPIFWYPRWNSGHAVNKFQQEIGGPLRGGDPGERLIVPGAGGSYFERPPWRPPQGLQAVWLHELFGSEELSARGPAIAERTPAAYVAVSAQTAATMAAREGDAVQVTVGDVQWPAALRIETSLPDGILGIPRGLPGVPVVLTDAAVSIQRSAS
ncbi:NADH-quinone oxidoreductase subunit NuoG [Sinimarinibacterium sp. CAU 1509]|uniref:NADH-quinone oxidoreductase subunit NuoG n=1 Tax=Sinimarinibacterium sp. CAU 1509 TaxID=2562283 RepID=UPI0010ACF115|nr:NADH-quinone oxidoreductase subunit NuoG [Sinimarinibacterium sp. CAU 1509]TJY64750.1 NADH-quinone oxidoreductase subunit NuoG [Sinimarinibacterium sp. CAU 1509]